jgi:ribosome-associated heat shock protein Hsp15
VAVRVDKWLWAVRVYKTRTQSTDACASGKVHVNDVAAKPATKVTVGDLVSARRGDQQIVYRVVTELEKRVSATIAATCVEDLSPPAPPRDPTGIDAIFAPRDRGTGRPTKRDRRAIDRLRSAE